MVNEVSSWFSNDTSSNGNSSPKHKQLKQTKGILKSEKSLKNEPKRRKSVKFYSLQSAAATNSETDDSFPVEILTDTKDNVDVLSLKSSTTEEILSDKTLTSYKENDTILISTTETPIPDKITNAAAPLNNNVKPFEPVSFIDGFVRRLYKTGFQVDLMNNILTQNQHFRLIENGTLQWSNGILIKKKLLSDLKNVTENESNHCTCMNFNNGSTIHFKVKSTEFPFTDNVMILYFNAIIKKIKENPTYIQDVLSSQPDMDKFQDIDLDSDDDESNSSIENSETKNIRVNENQTQSTSTTPTSHFNKISSFKKLLSASFYSSKNKEEDVTTNSNNNNQRNQSSQELIFSNVHDIETATDTDGHLLGDPTPSSKKKNSQNKKFYSLSSSSSSPKKSSIQMNSTTSNNELSSSPTTTTTTTTTSTSMATKSMQVLSKSFYSLSNRRLSETSEKAGNNNDTNQNITLMN